MLISLGLVHVFPQQTSEIDEGKLFSFLLDPLTQQIEVQVYFACHAAMLPGMHEDGVDGDVFDDNDVLTLGGIDGNGDHPYLVKHVSSCPRKCVEATCNLTL